MIKIIKHLFKLLTPIQRKGFYALQALAIIMALTQVVGVASIVPFMALVGDMNQLQEDTIFAQAYKASGITSESQFIFWLGVGVLVMLFISSVISDSSSFEYKSN